MNRLSILCLLVGLALLLVQGCATAANKRLDDKLGQETSIQSRNDLRSETNASLAHASLTQAQRERLADLQKSTNAQMDQLGQQSLKLRALLVQDVLSSSYDIDEVNLIKHRLSDVETRRLDVIFDAVSQANQIMGRQSVENQRVFNDFFERQGSRD